MANKTDFPLVSIVVINWNGSNTIETCLRLILKSSYRNYEVIVIDNNSWDDSPKIIEEKFPQVRLIRSQENVGYAKACNIGIKAAGGDYLTFIANDIYLDSRWLSQVLDATRSSEKVGIAGGIIYYHDPSSIVWGGGGKIDLVTGQTWQLGAYESSVQSKDIDYISGGAVLIKKKLFEKVGLLDECFFLYAEDLDICLRATRAGYDLKLVPEASAWHIAPLQLKNIPFRTYYLNVKSSIRLYFKHFPLRYVILSSFFQLFLIPFFEVFRFGQPPVYFALRILAFVSNLSKIKQIFLEKARANCLGKLKLKRRLNELLVIGRQRFVSKKYRGF